MLASNLVIFCDVNVYLLRRNDVTKHLPVASPRVCVSSIHAADFLLHSNICRHVKPTEPYRYLDLNTTMPSLAHTRPKTYGKGSRVSRITGRKGGMGLIRKYNIMMKRQEFRELAKSMGWTKFS